MIKPIPNWLSDDGETSRYQCVFCGTRKSVKYKIVYKSDRVPSLPCCNRCVMSRELFLEED